MSATDPALNRSHHLRNIRRAARAGFALTFLVLGKLIPRRRNLWLFGNRAGFSDNSRYLMEYVSAECPEVRAVWVAHDDESLRNAQEAGLETYRAGSLGAMLLSFRARVGFVSQGLSDLNRAAVGGMILVNLYHGTAFKRIGLDSAVTWSVVSGPPTRLANRLVRWLFRLWMSQVDIVVAPSPTVASHLRSAFGLSADRVPVLGTPRTDIILESRDSGCEAGNTYRRQVGVSLSKRLILYAPTWREYGDARPLFRTFVPEEWASLLKELDAQLLIRMHPNMRASPDLRSDLSTPSNRITWFDSREWTDVNILLCEFDLLVTDFSSILFDYAVLERPIVFYAPDYREYLAARSFYRPYEELTEGAHTDTWNGVASRVLEALGDYDGYAGRPSKVITDRYNAFLDTGNRRRIVEYVQAEL